MQLTEKQQEYWSRNLKITAVLLFIWFVVTFVMGYYAIRSTEINFFGWPFAFYMAAQGSLIIYVVIIWYYAKKMSKLDLVYGVEEGETYNGRHCEFKPGLLQPAEEVLHLVHGRFHRLPHRPRHR